MFLWVFFTLVHLFVGGGGEGWVSCRGLCVEVRRQFLMLSFYHMGSRDGIQVIRFGRGKHFTC